MEKKNNKSIIILLLLILVILETGYITFNKFYEYTKLKEQKTMEKGYKIAIMQIVDKTKKCEIVPITINNKTINLVSMECLKDTIIKPLNNQTENKTFN